MLNLQELLDTFEYGHKFRIRIWCNNETAQILELDFPRRIHSSPLCDYIKSSSEGMKSCVRCKKCTEYLVHRSGTDGVCVHGLYEIVQPVISNGRHTATVYIGNMVDNQSESELKLRKSCEKYGLSFSKAKALLYKAECEFDPDIIKKPPKSLRIQLRKNLKGIRFYTVTLCLNRYHILWIICFTAILP